MSESVACEIERFNRLAPLHNPPNVAGYRAARAVLPHCPHVAVFDTAFHQTIPPRAFLYGIPYELHRRHQLRRYGFHGTSHSYVAQRYARIQGRPVEDFRLITCHLGNGCSVCAVNRGKSVDTSMGVTPLEGLVMSSRGGDFDFARLRSEVLSGSYPLGCTVAMLVEPLNLNPQMDSWRGQAIAPSISLLGSKRQSGKSGCSRHCPLHASPLGLLARQHLDPAVAPFVTFDGIYSPIES